MKSIISRVTAIATLGTSLAMSPVALAQCGNSSGCGQDDPALSRVADAERERGDIVDTAVSAKGFSTLVAAVKAAGLVDALKGKGPFTVFAPSDAAFKRLKKGTLDSLLRPENRHRLRDILLYHVVPSRLLAKTVVRLPGATTLNGQRIDIHVGEGGVRVDGAKVVKTDIECSNGVIHVIDKVILPASKNVVESAAAAPSFKTLVTAVKAAGLVKALVGKGPFTVLAPTNSAFQKLPAGTLEGLLKHENRDKLQQILKLHVIPGRVFSDGAIKAGKAKTLAGTEVTFTIRDGQVYANGAKIIRTDLDASNGVIHVLDDVILE